MLKRPASILAASAIAACLACSKPASRTPAKDTLYRHLDGDPPSLDPITTSEEIGTRVEELIFRPLLGVDRELRPVPSLARTWAASSDGLVYDFRLDPSARWDDGSPITSADVAYTIERVRDPKVPAVNWRWGFEDVAKVETPDPLTVILHFEHPYADRLFAFNVSIVSAAAFRKDAQSQGRHPMGSGPYRLESWEPNQNITLLRRADSPAERYAFSKVVFRVIPDNAVRFRAGLRGELDEFRVTRDQRPVAEKSTEFLKHNRLLKAPQFSIVMLIYNCRHPFLSDRRVRQALGLAWPRQTTAMRLYPPDGAKLISGPYPAGAAEIAPDVKPPEQNIDAAARLLDQAGWKAGPDGSRRRGKEKASIELLYPAGLPAYASIAQILQQGYAKVGVELKLRALDWAACSERIAAGEFDVAPEGNTFLPPHLDQYLYFHSRQTPPDGQNFGFYKNPEADRVMEETQREMDSTRRLELYHRLHRILASDPPADFLWSAEQYWGVSRSLAGVETSPLGLFHFLPGSLGWKPVAPSR